MKRCPYCEDQFFDGDEEYENHLRMHESGMRLAYGSSSTPASAREDEKRGGEKKRVLACKVCEKTFQSGRGFAQHQQKAKTVYNCQECPKKFCNQFDLSKHLRTDHVIIEDAVDFDMANPICPETGFESTEGYRNEVDRHINSIVSRTKKSSWHTIVNRQLPIGFSYSDLRDLLLEVTTDITCAYKINISFGAMLYKGVEDVYRYFYPSNNSLLFELPFLVSRTLDLNKFFKKLVDKDVVGINYQRRPSSGWVIAGMPNVEISIYLLNMRPLQNKSDNELTIQKYLSITANDDKSDAGENDDNDSDSSRGSDEFSIEF